MFVENAAVRCHDDSESRVILFIAVVVFVIFRSKNYQKALEYLEKSITIDKEAFSVDKKNAEVSNRISDSHEKMGEIYEKIGDKSKAAFQKSESDRFEKYKIELVNALRSNH